jgi:hypothetical protein
VPRTTAVFMNVLPPLLSPRDVPGRPGSCHLFNGLAGVVPNE